jgi:heme-degrading monooxygenase HmoA
MDHRKSFLFLSFLALAACGSESVDPTNTDPTPTNNDPPGIAGCTRGTLESDIQTGPLAGPGVDPATGTLLPLPATAILSSTYIAIGSGDKTKRFGEVMGPISEALAKQPGLLAIRTGRSDSCNTARTLTVWKDEESMLAYVVGPAHSAAMMDVGNISRGGSIASHWPAPTNIEEITWEGALALLAKDNEGPFY